MNKKQHPRTEFIIVRVSKKEKTQIIQDANDVSMELSDYYRNRLLNKKASAEA